MLDEIAIGRIGQQMGNLAVNFISLEREIEILQETTTSKQHRIETLEQDLNLVSEQRDSLQREVHRLEDLLSKTT
jgi:chromosome segregation ATPase